MVRLDDTEFDSVASAASAGAQPLPSQANYAQNVLDNFMLDYNQYDLQYQPDTWFDPAFDPYWQSYQDTAEPQWDPTSADQSWYTDIPLPEEAPPQVDPFAQYYTDTSNEDIFTSNSLNSLGLPNDQYTSGSYTDFDQALRDQMDAAAAEMGQTAAIPGMGQAAETGLVTSTDNLTIPWSNGNVWMDNGAGSGFWLNERGQVWVDGQWKNTSNPQVYQLIWQSQDAAQRYQQYGEAYNPYGEGSYTSAGTGDVNALGLPSGQFSNPNLTDVQKARLFGYQLASNAAFDPRTQLKQYNERMASQVPMIDAGGMPIAGPTFTEIRQQQALGAQQYPIWDPFGYAHTAMDWKQPLGTDDPKAVFTLTGADGKPVGPGGRPLKDGEKPYTYRINPETGEGVGEYIDWLGKPHPYFIGKDGKFTYSQNELPVEDLVSGNAFIQDVAAAFGKDWDPSKLPYGLSWVTDALSPIGLLAAAMTLGLSVGATGAVGVTGQSAMKAAAISVGKEFLKDVVANAAGQLTADEIYKLTDNQVLAAIAGLVAGGAVGWKGDDLAKVGVNSATDAVTGYAKRDSLLDALNKINEPAPLGPKYYGPIFGPEYDGPTLGPRYEGPMQGPKYEGPERASKLNIEPANDNMFLDRNTGNLLSRDDVLRIAETTPLPDGQMLQPIGNDFYIHPQKGLVDATTVIEDAKAGAWTPGRAPEPQAPTAPAYTGTGIPGDISSTDLAAIAGGVADQEQQAIRTAQEAADAAAAKKAAAAAKARATLKRKAQIKQGITPPDITAAEELNGPAWQLIANMSSTPITTADAVRQTDEAASLIQKAVRAAEESNPGSVDASLNRIDNAIRTNDPDFRTTALDELNTIGANGGKVPAEPASPAAAPAPSASAVSPAPSSVAPAAPSPAPTNALPSPAAAPSSAPTAVLDRELSGVPEYQPRQNMVPAANAIDTTQVGVQPSQVGPRYEGSTPLIRRAITKVAETLQSAHDLNLSGANADSVRELRNRQLQRLKNTARAASGTMEERTAAMNAALRDRAEFDGILKLKIGRKAEEEITADVQRRVANGELSATDWAQFFGNKDRGSAWDRMRAGEKLTPSEIKAANKIFGTDIGEVDSQKALADLMAKLNPDQAQILKNAHEIIESNASLTPEQKAAAIAAFDAVTVDNQQILNQVPKSTFNRAVAAAERAVAGNLSDSWLSKLYVQKDVLEDAMLHSGLSREEAKKISDQMVQYEMKGKYKDFIPKENVEKYLRIKLMAQGMDRKSATFAAKNIVDPSNENGAKILLDQFPDQVPASILKDMAKTEPVPNGAHDVANYVKNWNQRWKNTQMSLPDVSVFLVQIPKAFATGGIEILAGMTNDILKTLNLRSFDSSLSDDIAKDVQYAIDGLGQNVATSEADFRNVTKGRESLFSTVPGIRKIDPYFVRAAEIMTNFQYGTVMGTIRKWNYEGNLMLAKAAGQDITDPLVRRQAAEVANARTSYWRGAQTTSRQNIEGALLMTPTMRRAQIAQIRQVTKLLDGSSTERLLALSTLASVGISSLVLGKFLNDQIGLDEFTFDPSDPKFGKITFRDPISGKNLTMNVFPSQQVGTYIARAVGDIVREPNKDGLLSAFTDIAKLGVSSASPAVGTAAKAAGVGFDPQQGKYTWGDYGKNMSITDKAVNILPIPLIGQTVYNEGFSPVSTGLQLAGGNVFEERPYNTRERWIKDNAERLGLKNEFGVPITSWSETSAAQKTKINQEFGKVASTDPDVARIQAERDKAKTADIQTQKDIDSKYINGATGLPKNPDAAKAYREEVQKFNYGISQRESFASELAGYKNNPNTEPMAKALASWQEAIKASTKGTEPDWEKVDQWLQSHPDEAKLVDKYFAERADTSLTPARKELDSTRKQIEASGYFDLRDESWAKVAKFYKLDPSVSFFDYKQSVLDKFQSDFEKQGYTPTMAYAEAEKKWNSTNVAQKQSDVYKAAVVDWINAGNAEEAYIAWQWGYFDPPKEAKEYLERLARQKGW